MIRLCRAIAENEGFHTIILMVIVVNALMMGLETFPEMNQSYESWFILVFAVSQIVFIIEIAIRLLAFAPRIGGFFRDFWNTFDFVIVTASLIPAIGPFSLVARLLRVLRVLRVFSVSDELRIFLTSTKNSIAVCTRAALILSVFIYIFAISGFYLFSEIEPQKWGSLGRAVLSIFYLLLLQDIDTFIEPLVAQSPLYLFFFLGVYFPVLVLMTNVIATVVAKNFSGEGGKQ